MKLLPPKTFETERLYLQACEYEHAHALFRNYTSDVLSSEYLQREPHHSISQAQGFIKFWGSESWRENDKYAWSLINKIDNQAYGLLILIIENDRADIHFGLSHKMWKKSYMTEAALKIMNWIKNETSIQEVFTVCDLENTASIKLLEKIGLKKIKMLENYIKLPSKGETMRDVWLYSWLRQE